MNVMGRAREGVKLTKTWYTSPSRTLRSAAVITCGMLTVSGTALADSGGQAPLTQEQMDHILAVDEYQRHKGDAKKLAYITYKVYQNRIFVPGQEEAQYCPECINPLSVFTQSNLNALRPSLAPPATLDEKLKRAADKAYNEVKDTNDAIAEREGAADAVFNGATAAAAIIDPTLAPVISIGKVLYPSVQPLALAEARSLDASTPNPSADFTIEWLAKAYQLRRDDRSEGKALATSFQSFSDNDVTLNSIEKTPVKAAIAQLEATKAAASAEHAVEGLVKQSNLEKRMLAALNELKEEAATRKTAAAAAAATKAKRDAIARDLGNAEGSLLMASYVFGPGGEKKAARVAATLAD